MPQKTFSILAILVLALAACGGDDASNGVATLETSTTEASSTETTVAAVDSEEQLIAFTQCMRDEGVDIGDPIVDADGNIAFGAVVGDASDGDGPRRPEGFREATEVCGDLLEGLELGFGRGDITEFEDQLLEFAQCMRDNGVEMDDPDFSNFGPGAEGDEGEPGQGGGPFGAIEFEDPLVQEALETCSALLDGFGPGGGRPAPGAGS